MLVAIFQPSAMDLEELRAFLAVVETGSFFSASTATGMSRTTLRRRVDSLEARAGVKLVERTRRGIVVTAPGEIIAQRGRQMLQETRALLENVREVGNEPAGPLHIVGPAGMPPFFPSPWMHWIRKKFPRVRVTLQLVDDPVAHLLDGADIALHFGPPPNGPWVSHELIRGDERLFASHSYLERKGPPTTIADLSEHDLICATSAGEDPTRWPNLHGGAFPIAPGLVVSSVAIAYEAMKAGAGISLLPIALVRIHDASSSSPPSRMLLGNLVGCEQMLQITVPEVLQNIPKIARVLEGTLRHYQPMMEVRLPAFPDG